LIDDSISNDVNIENDVNVENNLNEKLNTETGNSFFCKIDFSVEFVKKCSKYCDYILEL
jgi:hypothetical protein